MMRIRENIAVGFLVSLWVSWALADEVVIEDDLRDRPTDGRFSIHGGSFASGLGWEAANGDDWIEIDLGLGLDSGIAEVDLTHFNPSEAPDGPNPENYCPIFSMYEQGEISHHGTDTTEAFEVMAFSSGDPERAKMIKFTIWGPCKVDASYATSDGRQKEFQWNSEHAYHFKTTWSSADVFLRVEDRDQPEEAGALTLSWTCSVEPGLRYLYIGHDLSPYDPLVGVIYSNVKVTERTDPCDGHCTDGTQNCGEEGVDCGGGCAPCGGANTPPREGFIQVFSGASRLDQGGPPARRGDALLLKASVDDDETADPDMKNARFYLRTHGSEAWNALDSGAAVFNAGEPSDLKWQHTWTVPEGASAGWYDIRFYYEDEGRLSADQTQQNEFHVAVEGQDGGPDAGKVFPDADAAGQDTGKETSDAGVSQDASGAPAQVGTGGGCGCDTLPSGSAELPALLVFLLVMGCTTRPLRTSS